MAERSLARQEYAAVIEKCQKIVALDPRHARAHALWGDACLERGEFDQAILRYSFAVQFEPHSILYQEKLQQAVREEQIAESRQRRQAARPFAAPSKGRKGLRAIPGRPYLNAALVLMALGLIVWALKQPGPALSEQIAIPLHVAISALGLGSLVGMLLAFNGWLGSFDEELIYATVPDRPGGGAPVGLFLCIASLVWVYFGLVVYFVVALLNEYLSRSILIAFGVTFLILGMAALLAPQAWKPILLYGGNFVFVAVVLGWLAGNVGQNPW
jgi:tetratricopeptide (TPR) repeat protein